MPRRVGSAGGDADFSRLDRFDAVDTSGDAAMFVRFLERIESLPDVVARRRRGYELLAVQAGDTVADVGTGVGTAARELAALGADVIGFDLSAEMVAEASRRAGDGIRFAIADAAALPLPDASLAGYRAERVYQHIEAPAAALDEAFRVLRPGGRIVLVDQDWDTFVIDAGDREVTRAALRAFADSLRNGWIGRQYRRLLLDAGFEEVVVEADAQVYTEAEMGRALTGLVAEAARAAAVASEAVDAWARDQMQRCDEDRFLCSMTHFVASARRPAA